MTGGSGAALPLCCFLLSLLSNQGLVDVGNDTSTSDGGFDQGVQLLITTDRQLQVPGCNPFDFEILGCVPSQLQHLSGQVLEDGCAVDGCRGSHTPVAGGPSLQVPVDAADWELQPSSLGARHSLGLGLATVLARLAASLGEKGAR